MPTFDRHGTRILRDTSADIELTVYVGGTATAPDSPPTVSVTKADGTVVASGTGTGANPSVFTLTPVHTGDVNQLTAKWTGSWGGVSGQEFLTYHQVVGALLFNLAEARAFDNAALASTTTYTNATLIAARDRITESFEDVMGVPLGLAYGQETLDGQSEQDIWLQGNRVASIRSIKTRAVTTLTYTAFTAGELADTFVDLNGRVYREALGTFTYGRRNIVVEYEHGWQPIPDEIRRAGLWLLRDQLTGTNIPRNAVSQTDQLGTFNLSVPGLRGSYYGLPIVDEVVRRYRQVLPGIA